MLNQVSLCGRLTAEPVLRYTQSNKPVASFSLAVTRRFKNSEGKKESDFISCFIWGTAAENLASWSGKGDLMTVQGELRVRSYTSKEGAKVWVTEVAADTFDLLETRAERDARAMGRSEKAKPAEIYDPREYANPKTDALAAKSKQANDWVSEAASNIEGGNFEAVNQDEQDDGLPF